MVKRWMASPQICLLACQKFGCGLLVVEDGVDALFTN